MKKSKFFNLGLAAASIMLLASCSSVMNIASAAATVAGEQGLIDADIASSISSTASAISKAAEVITPEQEYYIGRAVAGTILENYKVYDSPNAQLYLNEICNTIAINSDMPVLYKGYYVAILDTDEVNAFATSGGHIMVSRGLISCATSEDSLAAVIAHEISHIQLQHSIKAIKSSRATDAILKTAGTALTLSDNAQAKEIVSGFGDTVNDIVSTMVESGYSQRQEFDADANALKLLAQAGYDPNAMDSMLQLLKSKEQGQTSGFAKTHPTPDARISNLKDSYKQYSGYTDKALRQARFEEVLRYL